MLLRLRMTFASLSLVGSQIGWLRLPGVLFSVVWADIRGEPWRKLAAPATEKERLSRKEMGQAVLLFRALRSRFGHERALKVIGEVVKEAAVIQIGSFIPKTLLENWRELDPETRDALLTEALNKFPNSHSESLYSDRDSFKYVISRCEFHELANGLGLPELATVFCAGDGLFFEREVPGAKFERPTTIASGGSCCDFRIRWKDAEPSQKP